MENAIWSLRVVLASTIARIRLLGTSSVTQAVIGRDSSFTMP
ncbi:Uncharacterised protein [Vibrio cholerae]|nr:Uncharacterised protein [Vibrio cholerae]